MNEFGKDLKTAGNATIRIVESGIKILKLACILSEIHSLCNLLLSVSLSLQQNSSGEIIKNKTNYSHNFLLYLFLFIPYH